MVKQYVVQFHCRWATEALGISTRWSWTDYVTEMRLSSFHSHFKFAKTTMFLCIICIKSHILLQLPVMFFQWDVMLEFILQAGSWVPETSMRKGSHPLHLPLKLCFLLWFSKHALTLSGCCLLSPLWAGLHHPYCQVQVYCLCVSITDAFDKLPRNPH